jgi:hypothetical protein
MKDGVLCLRLPPFFLPPEPAHIFLSDSDNRQKKLVESAICVRPYLG